MSALESYFVAKPDLVLLDLVMKGMYGLDVLTKLREMDPQARIIVVSADVQTSSHEMVAEAGAAAFMVKPFDADEMVATVQLDAERGALMQLNECSTTRSSSCSTSGSAAPAPRCRG